MTQKDILKLMQEKEETRMLLEKMKTENTRFENTIEATQVGTWEWNVKSGHLVLNEKWATMLGYTLEELQPISIQTWINLCHPDDLKKSEKILEEVFQKNIPDYEIEVRVKHKNGKWIWFLDRGKVISWSLDGEALLMYGSHTNINSFKEISVKLEESMEMYKNSQILLQSSLESFQDIIIISVDTTYCALYYNENFKKILKTQFNKNLKVGENILNYVDVLVYKNNLKRNLDLALSGTAHNVIETYGVNEDNYFETSFSPIYNENKEVIGVTSFARDITNKVLKEKELLYEKNLAQNYLNLAGSIIVVLDVNGNVTLINKKGCQVIGLEDKSIIGKNWFDRFSPEHRRPILKEMYAAALLKSNDELIPYQNNIITVKGEERIVFWESTLLYDKDNKVTGMISSGEDKTIETIKQNKLLESFDRLDRSQQISNVGSWELNLNTGLIWASQEAFNIYELDRKTDYISHFEIKNMVSDEERKRLDDALHNLIENNKPYDILFTLKFASTVKYIHSKASLSFDASGKPSKVLGVIKDITELKEKELELLYTSYHDALTGLYNRRYYEEQLLLLDKEAYYPLTLVMSDINGLKLINDAFGHDAGDELLKSAATVISSFCRETDLLARIGGDEFVIAMPNTSGKEAEDIIKKINNEAKKTTIASIELSISFGFETKKDKSVAIQDVYRSAEDLMYRVKLLEIPSMRSGAIGTILNTLYEKDKGSETHSRRVSDIAGKLAAAFGLNSQDVNEVKTAGLLHDIGKIIIPIPILTKTGSLTEAEYDLIKGHSEIGFRILNSTHDMRNISNIVLSHHERWDGLGYPRGTKESDIPLQSRIISIADSFDAMTSDRTYRKVFTNEQALEEILKFAGSQFDPELATVFSKNFKTIIEDLIH